jgi:hypothetical protein
MNPDDIIALRLANQQFSQTTLSDAAEIVAHFGAMQAQDYAAAKWSLGLRLRPTTDRAMEEAFNAGHILRTHILRPTWHFVTPADIRWMQALTAPRVHQTNAGRYRQLGLDAPTLVRAADRIVATLHDGPRTRPELGEALAAGGLDASGQRLAYMVMYAELEALIASGPRRGKQFTYTLLDTRAPATPAPMTDEEALAGLLRRYFRSHGPATDHDFARWASQTLVDTRRGLAALDHELETVTVEGQLYWYSPAAPPPREPSPTTRLVSIYDEYTIGYADRDLIGEPQLSQSLAGLGNALQHVILLDGRLAGTWRRIAGRHEVTAELSPLIPLSTADRQAIERAAGQLSAFLDRPVRVI